MKILVLNAGSSSLKYQLIENESGEVLIKGLCERIGIDGGHIENKVRGTKQDIYVEMPNHTVALNKVLEILVDKKIGAISSLSQIDAIGHRIVHGGEEFKKATKIEGDVLAKIKDLIPLAPLHNPANVQGIEACQKLMPNVPQVAVFDTAFHSTMQPTAYRYAIPTEDYTKHHIRKYGFHGTSHKYVSQRLAEITGKKGRFIILHIGNGASISAVNSGICQDTSMGYTPLDGCVMGTRSGSVDASILPVLCKKHNLTIEQAIDYLNKKSGWLGICGLSDSRDIENRSANPNDHSAEAEACRLANELRAYVDKKILGGYAFALGGVDAIAFTAGVGENSPIYRELVLTGLSSFGIKLDDNRNRVNFKRGEEQLISTDDSAVKVYVIPTNEELQIARETAEVLGL